MPRQALPFLNGTLLLEPILQRLEYPHFFGAIFKFDIFDPKRICDEKPILSRKTHRFSKSNRFDSKEQIEALGTRRSMCENLLLTLFGWDKNKIMFLGWQEQKSTQC